MGNAHGGWFVYVGGGTHTWRFIYFAPEADNGEAAIHMAWAEAVEMGQKPKGNYMAVPFSAITTRTAEGPQAEGTEALDQTVPLDHSDTGAVE